MENTLENKAKLFAMYLDQEVYCIEGWNRGVMICDAHKLVKEEFNYLKKSFLELKPLSSISDEDAIEVGKTCLIYANEYDNTVSDIELLHYCHTEYVQLEEYLRFTPQYVLDLLRSKGYALPWMGLSVEELVNRGWVKLKGETI